MSTNTCSWAWLTAGISPQTFITSYIYNVDLLFKYLHYGGCNAENCRNDTCDTVTGNCTQGCKIGRRGDYCEERTFINIY
jgi:hypothetical protein